MLNPFTLFQLPEQFTLNDEDLAQRYRTLAAQFHPDKFAAASVFEQKQAIMMSASLNEAYRVLRHPLNRAAALLANQGIDADAPEHTHFAPEFLMQQMLWRETLSEAKLAQDWEALTRLKNEITACQADLIQQLEQQFDLSDFHQAAQLVRQGRFLDKLQAEIQATLPDVGE